MSHVVTIAKEFRWEMGHRLPYHTEGCQNLHGHSYRLEVALTGATDSSGMVMDFGDMSALLKPTLLRLDHSFMVWEEDEHVLHFLESTGLKRTVVPFHSTAENIVAWLGASLSDSLRDHPRLQRLQLTLFETVTSSARTEIALK